MRRPALAPRSLALSTILALVVAAGSAAWAQDFDKVQIETTDLGHGIHMLTGSGGNLALCVGEDATFLIDDQYAPLTEKIVAAIAEVTERPVDFLLNTHWHFDHTGGNENFGGAGAVIVAHENVRKRLSTDQVIEALGGMEIPASPHAALPVITFEEAVSFHINGLDLRCFHVEHAHTDGDAMVYFEGANILHMGDVWFNGLYPFADWSAGGNLDGIVAACELVLEMIDDDTKIIPGHGPLATKAELTEYRDLMSAISQRIHALLDEGKSVEEIVAAKPTAEWDEAWGQAWLTGDQFVGIVAQGFVEAGD